MAHLVLINPPCGFATGIAWPVWGRDHWYSHFCKTKGKSLRAVVSVISLVISQLLCTLIKNNVHTKQTSPEAYKAREWRSEYLGNMHSCQLWAVCHCFVLCDFCELGSSSNKGVTVRPTLIVLMSLKCPIMKFVISLLHASIRSRTPYWPDPCNKCKYENSCLPQP